MKKLIFAIAFVLSAGNAFGAASSNLQEIKNTLDLESRRMAALFVRKIPSAQMHPDDIAIYNEVYLPWIKLLTSKPFNPTYGAPLDDASLKKIINVYNEIKAGKYSNWNPRPMNEQPESSSTGNVATQTDTDLMDIDDA